MLAAEQKRLAKIYKNATQFIPVLLEDDERLPVGEIYAPLLLAEDLDAMKRTRRPDAPSGNRIIKNMKEVFYVDEELSTSIFLKGDAGSGKTVFCLKLVESWSLLKQSTNQEHVCEKDSDFIKQVMEAAPFLRLEVYGSFTMPEGLCTTCNLQKCISEFDLLYYVALRDARVGKTSVVELVCDAVCNGVPNAMNRTKRLLSDDNIKCLIILDGLDEWSAPDGWTGLPDDYELSDQCTIMSTMRQWKFAYLTRKLKHDDRIVTVCGLSSYSIAKVVENIVVDFYGGDKEKMRQRFVDFYEKATSKVQGNIMRMPMVLVAACHLWCGEDSDDSLISTDVMNSPCRSHFNLILIDEMIKNSASRRCKQGSMNLHPAAKKKKENSQTHPRVPAILRTFKHIFRFIDMLLPFCELAYTDLVSPETKLIFYKGDLEEKLGKEMVALAHSIGLISQAKLCGKSKLNEPQKLSVSFYHKSIQEVLAAIYIKCETEDKVSELCEYCSTMEKIMEMANVIRSVMVLDSKVSSMISKHVIDIVNAESYMEEYRRTLDDENRVQQLYKVQLEWYSELKNSKILTGDTSSQPAIHISDIRLDLFSDIDAVQTTEKLMKDNVKNIISVMLVGVNHSLNSILKFLPDCPYLMALWVSCMQSKEDTDMLVTVLPRLTHLDTIRYNGHVDSPDDRTVVKAILSLKQLVRMDVMHADLRDDGVIVTEDMTQLRIVRLGPELDMSVTAWHRFLTSLLSIQETVDVKLESTNIDNSIVNEIQESALFTVTRDDRNRDANDRYDLLEFSTVHANTGEEFINRQLNN